MIVAAAVVFAVRTTASRDDGPHGAVRDAFVGGPGFALFYVGT